MKKKIPSKFKFQKYKSLGGADAETDSFLDSSFIDTGEYDALVDVTNPKSVIIGRTGSGKSALIKRIITQESKVINIEPETLSLKYLSNSTILEYLRQNGVNLNFFYKILWKHIFIVEIIKLYIGEENIKKESFFKKLTQFYSQDTKANKAKQNAVNYCKNWSNDFWEKSEHKVTSITEILEKNMLAELGISSEVLKAGISDSESKSVTVVQEVKHKAERVISEIQAEDLLNLMKILKDDVFNKTQRKFFLVIDDLDKNWVSQQLVYDLIGSMIEVLKEFQEKFKGVKIIIALRENLHNLVFSGKEHRGGQREKFTPLFLRLKWKSADLQKLINIRLERLSNNQTTIQSAFQNSHQSKKNGFEYIIERTYYRPRDIISFFNKIIEEADKKQFLTQSMIKLAEPKYSIERLQALEDEWFDNFGDISKIYGFLKNRHNGFNLKNVKEEAFADIYVMESSLNSLKGELKEIAQKWKISSGSQVDFRKFLKSALYILFRIGIIGIKRSPETPIQYFFDVEGNITSDDFTNDVKIYIHKSLYSALNIIVREQEIDYFEK